MILATRIFDTLNNGVKDLKEGTAYSKALFVVVCIYSFILLASCSNHNSNITAQFHPETISPYVKQQNKLISVSGYFICQDGSGNLYVLTKEGDIVWQRGKSKYLGCADGILTLEDDSQLVRAHIHGDIIQDELCPADYIPAMFLMHELNPHLGPDNQYGYVTSQGLWHFKPRFHSASLFFDGYANISVPDSAILREDGSIIPSKYYSDSCFCDKRLLIKTLSNTMDDYVYNYITEDGQLLIKTDAADEYAYPFENAMDFSEGRAAVKSNGLWGFIDVTGKIAIDFQYLQAYSYTNGAATVVTPDNRVTEIDMQGNLLHDPVELPEGYSLAGTGHGGCYPVKSSAGGYNLISKHGNLIFLTDYSYVHWSGVWELMKNNQGTAYDVYLPLCGVTLSDVCVRYVYCNTVQIKNRSKTYSLVDLNSGAILITTDDMSAFTEGLARVREGAKWGYIDQNGSWAIAPIYRYAEPFSGGIANTDQGAIANPLIYGDQWKSDLLDRAVHLGICTETFDLDSDCITYNEFVVLINNLFNLFDKLESQGIYVITRTPRAESQYGIFLNSIIKLYGEWGVNEDDFIARKDMAIILEKCAEFLGRSTDYFYMPYTDLNAISEEYKKSIAYCSTMNLFDIMNSEFEPGKKVSKRESLNGILSFFEAIILSSDNYEELNWIYS